MADKRLLDMIMSGGGKGAYLIDTDLRDADLQGADLQGADLFGANLIRADLRGANLQGARLQGAFAKNAFLSGAFLLGANLRDADLTNANLRDADLTNANLTRAILVGADFAGSDFQGAGLINAILRDANLIGADLSDAKLQGADLKNIKYDAKTKFPKGFTPPGDDRMASYTRSAAAKSKSKKTKIVEMIMSGEGAGADLRKVNLKDADLKGANLRRTDFRDANLQGADLEGANLRNVLLEGANLQVANLTKANLSGSDLARVKFKDVELRNADLRGAYLNDANFYGSDLNKANLSGADLSGANFKLSDLRGAILDDIKYDDKTKWPAKFKPPVESRMASRRKASVGISEISQQVEGLISNAFPAQGIDRAPTIIDMWKEGGSSYWFHFSVALKPVKTEYVTERANTSGFSAPTKFAYPATEQYLSKMVEKVVRSVFANPYEINLTDWPVKKLSYVSREDKRFGEKPIPYFDKYAFSFEFKIDLDEEMGSFNLSGRMASRRNRRASMDESAMISAFTFSIPLVWETYGGELMEDSPASKGKRRVPSEYMFTGEESDYVIPVSYEIPKAGKMSIRVTDSIPAEYLPPKQKVNHEETDDMLLWEINTHRKLVRPDDVTSGIYVNGFSVDDRKGEHIALLNRRTGMVMVMLMDGLQRIAAKGNLYPSKITGSGFMVPKDAFRLIYKGIPELTLEQLPEILEAVLTKVELADDADSVDYRDDFGDAGDFGDDFPPY